MIRLKSRILTFGVIVLLVCGIKQNCAATVDETGWIRTGTDSTGGYFITNGTTSVGQLNSHTNAATSGTKGGDYVTLGAGATASASSGATIEFDGPNNTFINSGTVNAPNHDKTTTEFANTGVAYYSCSGSGINNQLLINNGTIYGGDGMVRCSVPIEDTAVGFYSTNGIYNITIENSGFIYGGGSSLCSGSGSTPIALGSGIVLYDGGKSADINGVSITNSNFITGGTSLTTAYIVGTAVALESVGNVTNVYFQNLAGGQVYGGNNDSNGFINGSAVVFMASPNQSGSLSNVNFQNAGTVAGGNNDSNSDIRLGSMVGNVVGSGVVFWGGDGVFNLNIGNSGFITGGSNANGGNNGCYFGSVAGSGVAIFDKNQGVEDINGVTLGNTGTILGGNNAEYAYITGAGVGIVGLGNVLNVDIYNYKAGNIYGGNENYGGDGRDSYAGVVGSGVGIAADPENSGGYSVSNVGIANAGTIAGGNNNEEGRIVGSGIGIYASDGVYGVGILNGGYILGGNNNEYGTILGNGVGIYDNNDDGKDINGVTVNNFGWIAGGSNNRYDSDMAGVGVGILGEGNVSNISINNYGVVAGGDGNTYSSDFGGDGILVASYDGKVSNVSINNFGDVWGGSGVGREDGSNGIDIEGNSISHTTINNYYDIVGGNGGNGMVGCENDYGYNGGAGIYVDANYCDPDLTIYNAAGATILGGNGGNGTSGGGNGGPGVYISMNMGTNVQVTNRGTIIGGNAGTGGYAGEGIQTFGSNITIDNYGTVAPGSGLSQATVNGYPAVAISVSGSNNTINLYDHSVVKGTLQGLNSGSNNVLNLKFTGISPKAYAKLEQQLEAQGWSPGNPTFTGTFTIRGTTYYVDPLILNINGITSYELLGKTPNQDAVGASLDSATVNPTGSLLALYNAIDTSNVPQALEALSPQPYQIYSDIAEATANFMTLSIDERLNNLRDGSESIDTSGIGGASDNTTTAGYDKDGKTVVVPDQKALQKRWGFFAEGSGESTQIDPHGPDLQGTSFTSAGLMLGVDGKVNDHLVLGALFDYSYTTASLDAEGSTANVQTLGGGIYSGYHNGNWYGNGLAAYGHNTYDSTRAIIFPGFNSEALGSTSGSQEEVNIDGGYDFHLSDKLTVGPLAGLQYVHLDVDNFNEAGAGAADLAVSSQNVDSLRSRVGFRGDYHTQIAKEVAFAADFRVAWQHEFMDNSRAIGGDFIGSGLAPFSVQTISPQRDAALVGVGANFTVRDTMTVFFDYDVQAGQDSYLEQSIKGGLKFSF